MKQLSRLLDSMPIRPHLKKCFGYSEKKGGKVGERHRWSGDISGPGWGKGHCIWCHRDLEQLLLKPEKAMSLEHAIALGGTHADADPAAFDMRAYALGKPQPRLGKNGD